MLAPSSDAVNIKFRASSANRTLLEMGVQYSRKPLYEHKKWSRQLLYAAGSVPVCRSFLLNRPLVFLGPLAKHGGGCQGEHDPQEDKHPALRGWRSHDVGIGRCIILRNGR